MPVADLLVDAAAGHKVISFMDGNAKGFHWTVFMVPNLRIFCGFCAKGQLFSRIRLK
jgi:hypothetical protein